MSIIDPIKLDARIRATLAVVNSEGLRLHERRGDLTDQGLRTQWQAVTPKYSPQVEEIAAEVKAFADALNNVHTFEREHLLPTVPAAGLTAAQELTVARFMSRPGVLEIENLLGVIKPHLETPIATVLVQEIQLRNENVTDDYVAGLLAQESTLYGEAVQAVQAGKTILGVLNQGVEALRNALAVSNVNGAPLDSHNRPGAFLPSLQEMFGPEVKFTIGDTGNVHV